MGKKLVIVESPTKCKTIGRYLGAEYIVKATMGHVSDLPERELGVDLENEFLPKYVVAKGKKKLITELKKDAKESDTIYLAPDPDREGEAIAWHVAEAIKADPSKLKRIQFNEITQSAIKEAIRNPHDIDMNKVNAQQARRVLDRIVGYKISPILWKTLYRGLSAGRVQSVALRIICEREREIEGFVPEEYWTVTADMRYQGIPFLAKLHSVDGKKTVISNEEQAALIEQAVVGKPFIVSDVVKKEKKRKPYAPFITSTLQQDAARKFGFSAAKTMMVAQQLYEGLELGALGTVGLITYMRTDSTRISSEALEGAKSVIAELFDKPYHIKEARYYGKSKNAQDAHEAIRPSYVTLDHAPNRIQDYLSKDQLRLYELIWKRFLASQMPDAVIDATRIDMNVANATFRSNGSVIKFDGFLAIYEESKESKDGEENDNGVLPDLKVDTSVDPEKIVKKQHFTQPPARFSEAMLVRELEKKGIGRPSTYAQIIDTLKKRNYVEVDKKRFTPTEIAFKVIDILVAQFKDVLEVGFTADMELKLDAVEEGSVEWINVLKEFYAPFEQQLTAVTGRLKELKEEHQEITDKECPGCGEHKLIVRWSRNGKFLACPGFPKCRYTESLEPEVREETDKLCEKCGSPMVIISRGGSKFLGCSTYPECKNIKSVTTGIKCPTEGCEGELVERKTKRGKVFFGCNAYPKCRYATWDKPLQEDCPSCGHKILVEKETKAKGLFKMCPECKTEFGTEGKIEKGTVDSE